MGVLFFWMNDLSKNQEKTKQFLELSLSMWVPLVGMASLPFMDEANDKLLALFSLFESPGEEKV
jgi:hypothetical protein